MTAPTPPLSLLPTCQLWVDGTRFADGGTPGELDTDPVALTDLKVVWGRDNSLDQPEPGTCSFRVLDVGHGVRFTDKLHIGSLVEVKAAATIYPDPTVPVFAWDATFETGTVGVAPPSTATRAQVWVSTDRAAAGTKSAKITPSGGPARVIFPPGAYGGGAAWDAIPRTQQGMTWKFGCGVWASALVGETPTVVVVKPVAFTAPNAGAATVLSGYDLTVQGNGAWQAPEGSFVPPPGVWLGLCVEFTAGPEWDEAGYALAWNSVGAGVRWDDLGVVYVDSLKILAPAAGALRQGSVFAGRITDMQSQYDLSVGGTIVDVTCQTHLSELDNRYVGTTPWLSETLAARFANILTASGQTVSYVIDSSVQSVPITWRDVDSQPSGMLLHQLAQSVGGALWSASTDVGGAYLWLEDVNNRPAMSKLKKQGSVIVIVPRDPVGDARTIVLDACDLDLAPIVWQQSTEDDASRIVVTWQEQTTDGQGQPKPTSRDYTVTNDAAERARGRRRVQITTQLAAQADAALVADAVLARVGTPGWRVSGLTWDLSGVEKLDAVTLDKVMTALDGVKRLGLGVVITNMPDWMSPAVGTDVWLFLEGGTLRNTDGYWILDLVTSSAISQGQGKVRWDDLQGTVTPLATRTNRMPNPRAIQGGAANWTTLRGWGSGGNGTYSWQTGIGTPPVPGVTTANRKTWTVASGSGEGWFIQASTTTLFAVTAGTVYTVSAYVRHTSGGNKVCRMKLGWYNGTATTSSLITWTESTDYTVASGLTWTRISMTATAPTNSQGLLICPDWTTPGWAVGNTADCTAVLFEVAGSAGAYFDGSTADVAPIDYGWTGATDASTSTAVDTTVAVAGWTWDSFSPDITWNSLFGVGI